MTNIHHPTLTLDKLLERHGPNPLANAIFSAVSITVIYSYLAIDSFVNCQLFRIWERRHDGTNEAKRFLDILGNSSDFETLKTNRRVRELGERIKSLCEILGYRKPHEAIPSVWQDFKELVKVSRHFFIHPHPGKEHFQENAKRIFTQTKTGKYVRVAEEMLKYLYQSSGRLPPDWFGKNTLIGFKGIDILLGAGSAGGLTG